MYHPGSRNPRGEKSRHLHRSTSSPSSNNTFLLSGMSLYADEELGTLLDADTTSLPSVPTDPLQALSAALTCPAESSAQADALIAAGQRFEEHPDKLTELCVQLLPMVVDGGESLLRSWTLNMVALAVGRSGLKVDVKLKGRQSFIELLLHS